MPSFWNRAQELAQIKRHLGKGRFGYVTGRRRVGKTALLIRACEAFGGVYHQAVEGTSQQQLLHLTEEVREKFPILRDLTPKNWAEFFRLLSRERLPKLLVFDEFPYWVEGDSTLPSVLQKWVDHDLEKSRTLVVVSGSSQAMLHSQFLSPSSPLYGRASFHLHLEPMSYRWFCRALKHDEGDSVSFARFALVGGVPHYWKLMPRAGWVEQAQQLYFEPSAVLSEEPARLIRDERVVGTLPKAILDLIGRGVVKPSELASRLGMVQGNLSRSLALLLELGLIQKELPFGESSRTTKKVLYSIQDPALSFYYGTALPFRSRWSALARRQKEAVLNQHVSRHWENFCRQAHPGAGRYWEGDVGIDLVSYDRRSRCHEVAECKWSEVTAREERILLGKLQERFAQTRLSRKMKKVKFRIFSKKDLVFLAGRLGGV